MWRLPLCRGGWRQFKRSHRRMYRQVSLILVGSLLVLCIQGLLSYPIYAQSITQATITEILDGNQVFIQGRQAQINSIARQQQQVRTGASRASLLFNTGAIARLANNSSLMVGQCARLQQGSVLVNGALNGCTGSTVAGVRGTIYTLTVNQAGGGILKVFEGSVELTRTIEESTDTSGLPKTLSEDAMFPLKKGITTTTLWHHDVIAQVSPESDFIEITRDPVVVEEGQSITYGPQSEFGFIQQLTPADFESLIEGPFVADFSEDLPGFSELKVSFERLFPDIPFPAISLPSSADPAPPVPALY